MVFKILLAQGAWLASSTDEACSFDRQPAEETSFLTLKGVREDLWTACTLKDGHATCTEVPPVLQHKVHENKIQFTSKADHPQLTGLDFSAKRYSVSDGQPVNEICLRKDAKDKQLQMYVGRHKSSKPAQAFRDGITQTAMLYNYSKHTEWNKMNFVFEGEASFTFDGGQTLSHVVRLGQTGFTRPMVHLNEWNIAGPGCRMFTQTQPVEVDQPCLKCDKLCFQADVDAFFSLQYTFSVWPCPEAAIQCLGGVNSTIRDKALGVDSHFRTATLENQRPFRSH